MPEAELAFEDLPGNKEWAVREEKEDDGVVSWLVGKRSQLPGHGLLVVSSLHELTSSSRPILAAAAGPCAAPEDSAQSCTSNWSGPCLTLSVLTRFSQKNVVPNQPSNRS